MSSCQYGMVQPPCSKPPSRSSSFPPGACTTPSRVMNSETMSFRMTFSPYLDDDRGRAGSTSCMRFFREDGRRGETVVTRDMRSLVVLLVAVGCYRAERVAPPEPGKPVAAPVRHARTAADPLGFLPFDAQLVAHLDNVQLRQSSLWARFEP